MTRAGLLARAAGIVGCEREATHGDARDGLGRIAALWSADLGIVLGAVDVARLLVLMKAARAKGRPDLEDNWIDMAGYAAIAGELASEPAPAAGVACEAMARRRVSTKQEGMQDGGT